MRGRTRATKTLKRRVSALGCGATESLSLAFSSAAYTSYGGPRLDSCSMGLAILSALVRDVVQLYQSSIQSSIQI